MSEPFVAAIRVGPLSICTVDQVKDRLDGSVEQLVTVDAEWPDDGRHSAKVVTIWIHHPTLAERGGSHCAALTLLDADRRWWPILPSTLVVTPNDCEARLMPGVLAVLLLLLARRTGAGHEQRCVEQLYAMHIGHGATIDQRVVDDGDWYLNRGGRLSAAAKRWSLWTP